jgi:glycosyltransferase 2 family protein
LNTSASLRKAAIRGLLASLVVWALVLFAAGKAVPDWHTVITSIGEASPALIALAVLCFLLGHVADAMRMRSLAAAIHQEVSLLSCFQVVVASDFVAFVTPFLSGSIPCAVWMLSRRGLSSARASAVAVSGAAIGRVAISAIGIVAGSVLLMSPSGSAARGLLYPLMAVIPVNLLGSCLILIASYRSERADAVLGRFDNGFVLRIREALKSYSSAFQAILHDGLGPALIGSGWAFVHFSMQYSVAYIVMRSLGMQVGYFPVLAAELVVLLVASASPTPGGSGAAELGAYSLFLSLSSPERLAAFIIIWRLLTYWFMIAMGAVAFVHELRTTRSPSA